MSTHPLTRYRKAQNLTLEAFAALVGAKKSMVWKWENGAAEPRAKYRQKIVEVTKGDVSTLDLLGGTTKVQEDA